MSRVQLSLDTLWLLLYICNHLQFRVESSSGVPITRQIADQIRLQCAAGNLIPGQRLPSVRELAHQLAINQNTVLRVYERLTVEGILERRHGDGTYVADRLPNGQMRGQKTKLRGEFSRAARRARMLGIESEQIHEWVDQAIAEVVAKERLHHPAASG